jgi:hypothetical protein
MSKKSPTAPDNMPKTTLTVLPGALSNVVYPEGECQIQFGFGNPKSSKTTPKKDE